MSGSECFAYWVLLVCIVWLVFLCLHERHRCVIAIFVVSDPTLPWRFLVPTLGPVSWSFPSVNCCDLYDIHPLWIFVDLIEFCSLTATQRWFLIGLTDVWKGRGRGDIIVSCVSCERWWSPFSIAVQKQVSREMPHLDVLFDFLPWGSLVIVRV
jgi:hypothetical protein